jgi:hypothetical protein
MLHAVAQLPAPARNTLLTYVGVAVFLILCVSMPLVNDPVLLASITVYTQLLLALTAL